MRGKWRGKESKGRGWGLFHLENVVCLFPAPSLLPGQDLRLPGLGGLGRGPGILIPPPSGANRCQQLL